MNNKAKTLLMGAIIALLIVWGLVFTSDNRPYEMIFILLTIILMISGILKEWRETTKGLKFREIHHDERTLRIHHEAGLYSYVGCIFLVVFLHFMERNETVDMSDALFSAMILVTLIGVFCRNYTRRYYDKNGL